MHNNHTSRRVFISFPLVPAIALPLKNSLHSDDLECLTLCLRFPYAFPTLVHRVTFPLQISAAYTIIATRYRP